MWFSLSSLLVLALKITHIESLHYIKWANHVRQATVVRNVVCVIWCGIPYELNNNKQLIKVTKNIKKLEQVGLDPISQIKTLKTLPSYSSLLLSIFSTGTSLHHCDCCRSIVFLGAFLLWCHFPPSWLIG